MKSSIETAVVPALQHFTETTVEINTGVAGGLRHSTATRNLNGTDTTAVFFFINTFSLRQPEHNNFCYRSITTQHHRNSSSSSFTESYSAMRMRLLRESIRASGHLLLLLDHSNHYESSEQPITLDLEAWCLLEVAESQNNHSEAAVIGSSSIVIGKHTGCLCKFDIITPSSSWSVAEKDSSSPCGSDGSGSGGSGLWATNLKVDSRYSTAGK